MPMPSAVAEKYLPCENSIFNFGGTYTANTPPSVPATISGGVSLNVIKGGLKRAQGVKEMTNTGSGGAYEDVGTIKKVTGSFTCAYVSGTAPAFSEGQIFPVIIFNPNATWVFSGNVRVNNIDEPFLDVDSGLIFTFDVTSQGSYTITN